MEPVLCKKKVTTIVDEYYKIPSHSDMEPRINGVAISEYPPGNPAEFDRTAFTNSVMAYYESYGRKMQDVIAASTSPEEELDRAEENAFKDIWSIGVLLRPFYSAEFSERLNQIIRAFVLLEMQIVSFARQGWDTKTWTDRITNFPINDLANMLATYNSFYTRDNIKMLWTTITESWTNAIRAKMAKDTAKFDEHINKANENLRSFASYLAQGVIQQHSNRFFEAAPTL